MTENEFINIENDFIKIINENLEAYIAVVEQAVLREAMSYSLLAGGKRLRPLLLLAAAYDECGDIKGSLPFACALECIHTYSLIHDDLPALDNDDLRRGKPTNHIQFGEATAILAGDGLLNIAFEIMSDYCMLNTNFRNNYAMNKIAKACGVNGMISGQMDDMKYSGIESVNKIPSESELLYMYKRKTGRLIYAAITCGAVLGGMNPQDSVFLEISNAAEYLGEAFQIKDDILDETSDSVNLGKPAKSDEKNKKNTYTAVFGIEKSKMRFLELSEKTLKTFENVFGCRSMLALLSKQMMNRTK